MQLQTDYIDYSVGIRAPMIEVKSKLKTLGQVSKVIQPIDMTIEQGKLTFL